MKELMCKDKDDPNKYVENEVELEVKGEDVDSDFVIA